MLLLRVLFAATFTIGGLVVACSYQAPTNAVAGPQPGESTASLSSDPSVPSPTVEGARPPSPSLESPDGSRAQLAAGPTNVAAIEGLATTDAGSPPFDGGTLGDAGRVWRPDATIRDGGMVGDATVARDAGGAVIGDAAIARDAGGVADAGTIGVRDAAVPPIGPGTGNAPNPPGGPGTGNAPNPPGGPGTGNAPNPTR